MDIGCGSDSGGSIINASNFNYVGFLTKEFK